MGWDAYNNEPQSSNNNRSFNNRVNNNRMHQQQQNCNNTEQDAAIWNQYDKEHGAAHPNNAHLVHNRSSEQMNRYNNNKQSRSQSMNNPHRWH